MDKHECTYISEPMSPQHRPLSFPPPDTKRMVIAQGRVVVLGGIKLKEYVCMHVCVYLYMHACECAFVHACM